MPASFSTAFPTDGANVNASGRPFTPFAATRLPYTLTLSVSSHVGLTLNLQVISFPATGEVMSAAVEVSRVTRFRVSLTSLNPSKSEYPRTTFPDADSKTNFASANDDPVLEATE